jgi:hypothetical protein
MANKDLEARFAALKEVAATHKSELDLSLVVGGVHVEELYRVFHSYDEGNTLDSQLTAMERLLADPRTEAVATGIDKLTDAEALGQLVSNLINARGSDYNTALKAFHSITDTDPEDKDRWQASLAIVHRILEDDSLRDATEATAQTRDEEASTHREGIDTNPAAKANWVEGDEAITDAELRQEHTPRPVTDEGTPTSE